jgi:Plasmid pRiA4b ORF-3-like protein
VHVASRTFKYPDPLGSTAEIAHPYAASEHNVPSGDQVQVGAVPLPVGESMVFHFDFGDDWMFDVKLEEIRPPDPKLKKPKLLESHGKAPKQYPDWDE